MVENRTCFYCADFKEGKCYGVLNNPSFDEDEMREKMHDTLCDWLSGSWAYDIAGEVMMIFKKSLAITIKNPHDFYCARWR